MSKQRARGMSTCRLCGEPFREGEPVVEREAGRYVHRVCAQAEDANR